MVKERRRGVQEELVEYFRAGVTARSATQIAGVNRNTAILLYHKLREVIFAELEAETLLRMQTSYDLARAREHEAEIKVGKLALAA